MRGVAKRCRFRWGWLLWIPVVCSGVFHVLPAFSQTLRYPRKPDADHGAMLYREGCVACHGATGAGAPETSTEFRRPDTFPDFTRCDQTTPEPNMQWKAIIVGGGPARGFSEIMP